MFESPLLPHVDRPAPLLELTVAPTPAADLEPVDDLLAGVAEVDLTPPPGMPKAGHSKNARDGNGFRSRIRSRVIHLRRGTQSLALVQNDLLGGSSLVHHLVARAVAEDTDVRLPGLFMGATHTHAGPGQYHGSEFFNRNASNRGGFDPAYTQLVVDQIAHAVRRAVASRRPARAAFGATEVWGLTRNRSHEAYVRNETVIDKRTDAHRKFASVNPWLHLLRVDGAAAGGGFEPLGAMVIFSVHGTGISQRDRSYNADIWAYLVGELGHRIEGATGTRPVVGAVEGTHGDVAPAVRPGILVFPETERVGRQIGVAAAELHQRLEGKLRSDLELAAGFREVDLDRSSRVDGVTLPEPATGAACLAGAHENVTPVLHRIPPFAPNHPKPGARGPHGAKWVVGSRWLQSRLLPIESYLRVLPFHVLRIGPTMIVGLPWEVTVESGRRVEAAVRATIGSAAATGVDQIAVSSLADEQINYLTTPEEYGLQRYEGGNTTYGPNSQPFATAHAARLASEVVRGGSVADHLALRRWRMHTHRYLAGPDGIAVGRRQLGEPFYVDPTADEDGYWQLTWRDVSPGDLAWNEPLVRVEVADGRGGWEPARREGRLVDDQGWWLGLTHLGPDSVSGHRYAVRWYDPPLGERPAHRFVLAANGRQPRYEATPFG